MIPAAQHQTKVALRIMPFITKSATLVAIPAATPPSRMRGQFIASLLPCYPGWGPANGKRPAGMREGTLRPQGSPVSDSARPPRRAAPPPHEATRQLTWSSVSSVSSGKFWSGRKALSASRACPSRSGRSVLNRYEDSVDDESRIGERW
jgi:hypothetical protein